MRPSSRQYSLFALHFLVVFGAYFATAYWGLRQYAINDFATLIWPASAIGIAAVYLLGYRIATAIALAAFAVNFITGAPLLASIAVAAGNTLEAVVGVWLLHNFRFKPLFGRLIDSFVFIMVAISTTIIAATIGTLALASTRLLDAPDVPITWLAWWVGDTIGILVLAPFAIRWLTEPFSRSRRTFGQFLESIAFFIVLIVASLLVFWDPIPGLSGILSPYMVFVPLTWGALRMGPRIVTLAIATVAAIATLGTLGGTGPYAPVTSGRELFLMQLFVSTTAFIFYLFVAAVEERKQTSRRLQESVDELTEDVQEISAADQAKNDFIATLSHELRNPLAPILSTLEIIRTGKAKKEEMQSLITVTYENVLRMARLLDDLLDVARISRKQFTLQMGIISLSSVIEHAASMAKPVMQRYHHTFTIEAPPSDISLHADQLRIEQIIVNILTNAAKYTPPHGTIVLRAKEARGPRNEPGVEIHVRDNGIGIPQHLLEKVFEPFTRLSGQKLSESAGLGIGLSLAKRLVELHGGTIKAKSDGPDMGSEFIVWLPAAHPVILLPAGGEKKAKVPPQSQKPIKKHRSKTVLLVDDNKEAASAIAQLLNHSGHEARVAYDGAQALATLADFRPDVLFLDIALPGESGYDLIRTIRNYLDPSPRIVALTGYGADEDKARAREAGFDDFLTKPVSIAELERVLLLEA